MKPLIELNIIEKARLLHQLFPEEIRGFVSFIETVANSISNEPDKVKDNWGGSRPLSADIWITIAKDLHERIPKNGEKLITDSRRFADQLFDGYTGKFTIQCLQNYIAICPNSRFNKAIELLFDV